MISRASNYSTLERTNVKATVDTHTHESDTLVPIKLTHTQTQQQSKKMTKLPPTKPI